MPDLPSRPLRAPELPDDADREARIEQLLLAGLDHYFAGQYERAINVWTRVVFLERHHDRARAYIERARGAMAERLRRSDECLHEGVSAYNAGDVDRARELLTRALEQGNDGADVFLERLNRAEAALPDPGAFDERTSDRGSSSKNLAPVPLARRGKVTAALVAIGVGATMLVSGLPLGTWLSEWSMVDARPTARPASLEPLPIVRRADVTLDRARELQAAGRLRDALLALDAIDGADPVRPEADRLRADLQEEIFAAAGIPAGMSEAGGGRP
jgi:tetratricopeptide (TPR) repeat protein